MKMSTVGLEGAPPRHAYPAPLHSGQLVVIADEPFPGYITGFRDDGSIGVRFDSGCRTVWREQIVWRQLWRGYGVDDWPHERPVAALGDIQGTEGSR